MDLYEFFIETFCGFRISIVFSVEIFKALFLTLELCGGDASIGEEFHDFVDNDFDINGLKYVFGNI